MKTNEIITEKWSEKYKRSINCSNPKGFSQRAHCQGRKKNESADQVTDLNEGIGQTIALFAVVGGLLFGGAGYVAYQDQQLMDEWLTVYQKIKYKDPVQAKKIKELINQYDSSGFVHGSSKRMTRTEIEQIIDDTRSKWDNVEK